MSRISSTGNSVKPSPFRSARSVARTRVRSVNKRRHKSTARFVFAVISQHERGEEDQLVVLPVCSVCGEIISDFDEANLIASTREEDDLTPKRIGTTNIGDPLLLISDEVFAVHGHCDPGWKPWKPLTTVFKSDQRYLWEKSFNERGIK